jgi:hypothetical protein
MSVTIFPPTALQPFYPEYSYSVAGIDPTGEIYALRDYRKVTLITSLPMRVPELL